MVESGLLARRGKQYVLLKKWNFNDNDRNSQKSLHRSTFAAPTASANGSANRGVTAYAARGSS
jgi:hypothetical protein